ncbi:MAG: hypothetical protein K2R98_03450 [Gemmataceae bacterium]|nr:hypothetical protein [Gemmataceae bacterium]
MSGPILDREEYIEQAYFYRTLRERMLTNVAAQEIIQHVHEELLATTRLPYAVQFLSAELKHSGLLSSGFARLPHYFTAFQAFVVRQAEKEGMRFNMHSALLILEREAQYRADPATPAGMFIYQFEVLSRNRLGYDDGLFAMAEDPLYDSAWRDYIDLVRRQVGAVDFADLLYLRSESWVQDQRRQDPNFEPSKPSLVGAKEGRIAKANRNRDPLYLFAALQRQLGYPEVPRPRPRDDFQSKIDALHAKLNEWDARLKLVEGELRGQVDLSQLGRPDLLRDD